MTDPLTQPGIKALWWIFCVINLIANLIGWVVILSLLLGTGTATIKSPWGNASIPPAALSEQRGA